MAAVSWPVGSQCSQAPKIYTQTPRQIPGRSDKHPDILLWCERTKKHWDYEQSLSGPSKCTQKDRECVASYVYLSSQKQFQSYIFFIELKLYLDTPVLSIYIYLYIYLYTFWNMSVHWFHNIGKYINRYRRMFKLCIDMLAFSIRLSKSLRRLNLIRRFSSIRRFNNKYRFNWMRRWSQRVSRGRGPS